MNTQNPVEVKRFDTIKTDIHKFLESLMREIEKTEQTIQPILRNIPQCDKDVPNKLNESYCGFEELMFDIIRTITEATDRIIAIRERSAI